MGQATLLGAREPTLLWFEAPETPVVWWSLFVSRKYQTHVSCLLVCCVLLAFLFATRPPMVCAVLKKDVSYKQK